MDLRRSGSGEGLAIAAIANHARLRIVRPMKPAPKAIRRREGDLIKINLGDDRHCYAQVATGALIVFFGGVFAEDIGSEEIARLPVIFSHMCHE